MRLRGRQSRGLVVLWGEREKRCEHDARPHRRADGDVHRLEGSRQAVQHHRRPDDDLQHNHEEHDCRAGPARSRRPNRCNNRQRVREQPVRPMDDGERTGAGPHLSVAERKSAARGRRAEIRRERAEKYGHKRERD